MSEGQLDQLSDLCHLFSAATNIIVTDFVEISLLIFSLNGITFAVNDCVLGHDAIFGRINFDHLELDLSHRGTDSEEVALLDGSVGFSEVWGEENVEEGTGETFDCVCNGKNGNALGLKKGVSYRVLMGGLVEGSLHI